MKIEYIDKVNAEKFKNSDDYFYVCVMCERSVLLDDSMSHQGYNLVCNRCYYRMLDVLNTPYLMDEIHKAGMYRKSIKEGE